jgi:hypothetical protein
MQVGCETLKPADRVWIAIWANGDVMRAVAHVDSGGVGMHYLQAWVIGPEPPGQFVPLLPIAS